MLTDIELQQQPLTIEQVKDLVKEEFAAVDRVIINHLHSDIALIEDISKHIINSGGKRLRPLLVLLTAKALDYSEQDHIALAAVIEFLHTATLLHDDVVDNSTLRRGKLTANTIWGNASSVLVGDFLYSRMFELLTRLKNFEVTDILVKTTNAIAEGEVLQLMRRHDPELDESYYMKVIGNKTARLFQAATEVAAAISKCSGTERESVINFGFHLGMAFQLVDDALDYMGNSEELGKNIGDDLAEGKVTLPLIHAMRHANSSQTKLIKDAIQQGGTEKLDVIKQAITESNSLAYTFEKAKEQTNLALTAVSSLRPSVYQEGLTHLALFTQDRRA